MVPILLSSDPYTVVPSTLSLPIRLPVSLSLIAIDISSCGTPLTSKLEASTIVPPEPKVLQRLFATSRLAAHTVCGDTFSGRAVGHEVSRRGGRAGRPPRQTRSSPLTWVYASLQ